MKKIDADSAEKIRNILMLARSRGQDSVAALDLAGYLRHPASRRRDHLEVLEGLIDTVRHIRIPPEIKTPLDLKNAIITGLEGARNDILKAVE